MIGNLSMDYYRFVYKANFFNNERKTTLKHKFDTLEYN